MYLIYDAASGIPGIYPKSCGSRLCPYISKIAALLQLLQSLLLILVGECSIPHIFLHLGLNVLQGEAVAFFEA
jgi:hypothetical protein